MTKNEFDDAKTLWKMFYARESFKQVESACSHILDQKLDTDHPLYYPLLTSVYVLYGKPFKRSNLVGSLSEEFVPDELKELHDVLVAHRDKFYAHTDAKSFKLSGHGDANQVRFLVTPGQMRLFGTQFRARPPLLPKVVELCRALQTKVTYHIEKLQERHQQKIPCATGEYTINILDQSGPFVIKEKPIGPFNETIAAPNPG